VPLGGFEFGENRWKENLPYGRAYFKFLHTLYRLDDLKLESNKQIKQRR